MLNRRTRVIVKRELLSKLFSKTFILMTLLIPIFLVGLMGFQTFVYTYESDKGTSLRFVTEDASAVRQLQETVGKSESLAGSKYIIAYDSLNGLKPEDYVRRFKANLQDESLTGLLIIPATAMKDKKLYYYSLNPNNQTVFQKIKAPINEVLINAFFKERTLSADEKRFVRTSVDFEGFRITKDNKIEQESSGNIILSFLFTFFLYFSLIMIGTNLMRSVVEEKANKIIEVILSSVNASELLTGKILGTAITGVIQMAIWLLPVVFLITTNWFSIPDDFRIKIELWVVVYFLFNYLVALVTFLGLFAAVGSMFDNDQDSQSGIWPVMILIMIPFFISLGIVQRGDNDMSKWGSMLPFASLIVMPARIALVNVPWVQIGISIVVNAVTMLLVFPLAGKVYRVGILSTGKKATYKDALKWIKYKY